MKINNFSNIDSAYSAFEEKCGELPLRDSDELLDAIRANGLKWNDPDRWESFWDMLFDTAQGREWLYSESSPDFNPLI